ncbi:MAG: hypothetical protein ACC628_24200, partial [Pirellulaceae bacterium]
THWKKRGGDQNLFPLAVLPDRTHGSIVLPDAPGLSKVPKVQAQLGDLILQALKTNSPQQYNKAVGDWQVVTMKTRTYAGAFHNAQKHRAETFKKRNTPAEYFHEYYQIFVRAEDEFGVEIPDYFVSFMPKPKRGCFSLGSNLPKECVFFHDEVLEGTHVYRQMESNRCFFLDRFDIMRKGGFYDQLKAGQPKELTFTVTAADPGDRIAHFSRAKTLRRGAVELHRESPPEARWLKRHSTHFIRVVVPRAADPKIFALKRG